MRKLPDLQLFCGIFFKVFYVCFCSVEFFLFCFVNFGILIILNEIWRFTTVTVLMSATKRDDASHTNSCNIST